MLKVIEINELQVGMYVTQVINQDGEFRVTSAGKIKSASQKEDLIKKGIKELEIDLSKNSETESVTPSLNQIDKNAENYALQFEQSMNLYEQAKATQTQLMARIRKGKKFKLEEVNAISQQIMAQVFECEDTLNIATLISKSDQYFIEHSVNCSILIIAFAHYLGFDDKLAAELGTGALLMDIGMTKLPLLITEKPESFNQAETKKMHTHIKMALDLVKDIEMISDVSRDVIELHHERLDAKGYPQGLSEEHISTYGRMAAIVDVYDALTSKRPFREAYKPAEALRLISEELQGLDDDLVAQFILCMGAHPVGSLVKLASDKLAIVMRLNRKKPLSPVVMVFYDLTSKSNETPSQLDLVNHSDFIVNSVDPSDFGVNLIDFLHKTLSSH